MDFKKALIGIGQSLAAVAVLFILIGYAIGVIPTFPAIAQMLMLWPSLLAAILARRGALAIAPALIITCILAYFFGGPLGFVVAVIVTVIPIYAAEWLRRMKKPFWESAQIMFGVLFLCMIAALGVFTYFSGQQFVDAIIAIYPSVWRIIPQGAQLAVITVFQYFGYISSEIGNLAKSGQFDSSAYEIHIVNALKLFRNALISVTPSAIASGSTLGGFLIVALPRWCNVRKGDDHPAPFIMPEKWFVPKGIVASIFAAYLVTWLMTLFELPTIAIANYALMQMLNTVVCIQGVGAMERLLKLRGWSRGKRWGMLVLMWMLANFVLFMLGLHSIIFSKGGMNGDLQKKLEELKKQKENGGE